MFKQVLVEVLAVVAAHPSDVITAFDAYDNDINQHINSNGNRLMRRISALLPISHSARSTAVVAPSPRIGVFTPGDNTHRSVERWSEIVENNADILIKCQDMNRRRKEGNEMFQFIRQRFNPLLKKNWPKKMNIRHKNKVKKWRVMKLKRVAPETVNDSPSDFQFLEEYWGTRRHFIEIYPTVQTEREPTRDSPSAKHEIVERMAEDCVLMERATSELDRQLQSMDSQIKILSSARAWHLFCGSTSRPWRGFSKFTSRKRRKIPKNGPEDNPSEGYGYYKKRGVSKAEYLALTSAQCKSASKIGQARLNAEIARNCAQIRNEHIPGRNSTPTNHMRGGLPNQQGRADVSTPGSETRTQWTGGYNHNYVIGHSRVQSVSQEYFVDPTIN